MGSEVMDVLKNVKDLWTHDFGRYLVPALEIMVDNLILMFAVLFLTTPLYLLSIPMVLFMESHPSITLAVFIPLLFLFYILLMFVSLTARGIIDGGTVKVVDELMKGGEFRFWDVIRKGWKGKWKYIRLEFSVILVQLAVIYGIMGVMAAIAILIVILIVMEPMTVIILVLMIAGVMVLLVPVSIFLSPLPFFTFSIHHREREGALRSVGKALRFMLTRKKDTFILGSVFYLAIIIGGYVPGLGILIQSCANVFMYQCSLLLFPREHTKMEAGTSGGNR